jgi:hypothetical protein
MSLTIEPPYTEWQTILRRNQMVLDATWAQLGQSRVADIRREALAKARSYTQSLQDLAKSLTIELPSFRLDLGKDNVQPIIMTGHQPVIYHPGLARKERAAAQFIRDCGGVGIHVVIDSDEGDAGMLVWPRVHNGSLELKRASLAEEVTKAETGIYRAQRLRHADAIADIFVELQEDLRQSSLQQLLGRVGDVARVYTALAGQPVAAAHSIVRWSLCGRSWLEVPLSDLVVDSTLENVIRDFVADGDRLSSCYNSALTVYRKEHKIDNLANPFPNLKVTTVGSELPFWRVSGEKREPCFLEGGQAASAHETLFPRGAITTLLLRGYCSDLFIHGLGGARYDRFVNSLAQQYLGVRLPDFVVASETRYLFPEQVAKISAQLELVTNRKEIISRTSNFLGREIFSPEEEQRLQLIIAERERLRAAIQGSLTPEERSAVAHALNAANNEVRQIVEGGSLQQVIASAPSLRAALLRWGYREFPFFLFEPLQP